LRDTDVTLWDPVDGIVSGPPCPPWSSIGSRSGKNHSLAQVWDKVCEILCDQAKKGAVFFIIEMVPGMAHKPRGQAMSFHEQWIEDMSPMWSCQTFQVNSKDYGLPQCRRRNYTVGFNKSRLTMPPQPPPPELTLPPRPPPLGLASCQGHCRWGLQLQDVMHPGLPPFREEFCTPQQRANLQEFKRLAMEKLTDTGSTCDFVVCVQADRDPFKSSFGRLLRLDGSVSTLRTSNEMEWMLVFSLLGELKASRPVHPYERFALQGFQVSHCAGQQLSKSEVLLTTGNAMSVPVVGAIFTSVLRVMESEDVLKASCPRAPLRCCLEEELQQTQLELKRRCLQLDIAFLDAMRFCLEKKMAKRTRLDQRA
jgi:site-specific DNA-cytosine methylase